MRRTTVVAAAAGLVLLAAACGRDGVDPDAPDDATDATDDTVDDATDDAADDATDDGEGDGPQPDPDLVADPCGPHEGREMDAFIDLVAPVDDQQAAGEVDIVGCSNVFEATVSYRVLDGDGRTLDEGFTTAECGSGCVGAFRETIDLSSAAGEPVAYIQVFEQSAEDGSDQHLTERVVVLS